MVEAELAGGELSPAILATIAVAGEDVAAIELDLLTGQPVVAEQADDPGNLDLEVDRPDELVVGALEQAGPGRPPSRM